MAFSSSTRQRKVVLGGALAVAVLSVYCLLTGSDIVVASSHVSGSPASAFWTFALVFSLAMGGFVSLKLARGRPDVELTPKELILYWFPTARHVRWSDVVDVSDVMTTRHQFGPAVESVTVRTASGRSYRIRTGSLSARGDEVRRELIRAWSDASTGEYVELRGEHLSAARAPVEASCSS